ncbi:acyl carrier protein [Kitasatospora sp. MAA4]|uniref:acyl carrier protein n=1 Tax=Kitasatospora sp. MAA4 TaxID=3035093 RepID=UPI00247525C8|nr:acyl carrier protein [Kitasatospora sp. MAA4]MDH6136201.1 acyl carrier protein [Kitasatospora sp. MAA4]
MITTQIHQIWARELGLEPDGFSAEDDFFALGGHSLLMVRIQAAIMDELGVEVPIDELFDRPTVVLTSEYLERRPTTEAAR